jgi:tetratricopeptide (TPR) repeat protein
MSGSRPIAAAPLEGADILSELPGETGVLLWKTLRSVRLWAGASLEAQAAELFAPGSRERREAEITTGEVAPELERPLRRLAALLDPSEAMGKERVAAACGELAAWARGAGELATAVAFSEAAALASPGDADLALQVARDLQAKGELARAEGWCREAILLAPRSANRNAHVRALLILGIMTRMRGNFPAARQLANRALQMATRHGFDELRGSALHELFVMALERGDARVARRYMERALRAYGALHPHVRVLSNDLYCLWLSLGQFERSLPALKSIYPLFPERERLMVAANVVFAAGGVGDRTEFRRAWSLAAPMLEWRQTRGSLGNSLLSMAFGASGVGEWELARTMAERAHAVGEEKGEWGVVFDAEWALGRIREGLSALHPLAR